MAYNYKLLFLTVGSTGWLNGEDGALLKGGGWLSCSHFWPMTFPWYALLLKECRHMMPLEAETQIQFMVLSTQIPWAKQDTHQIHVTGANNNSFHRDGWWWENKYSLNSNLIYHIIRHKTQILGVFQIWLWKLAWPFKSHVLSGNLFKSVSPLVNWR